jgi:hypothetical protein
VVFPYLVYVPSVTRVPELGEAGGVALLSLLALARRRAR